MKLFLQQLGQPKYILWRTKIYLSYIIQDPGYNVTNIRYIRTGLVNKCIVGHAISWRYFRLGETLLS